MSNTRRSGRDRAVVIGGSMAGLLAARTLVDHFDQVVVLERDELHEEPSPRQGLPQARHIHVLLASGRQALERLVPNLIQDLVRHGAEDYDAIADLRWVSPGGLCPRFPSGIRMLGATRDFIDCGLRRQLRQHSRLQIRTGADVSELVFDTSAKRITGVAYTERPGGGVKTLSADLVVDASGRGSKTPRRLQTLGFAKPRETVVNGFLGYASRLVRLPAEVSTDWKVFYIQSSPPQSPRGGAIAAVEHGRWIVTLSGGGRDYPPSDEQGFRDFARSLPDRRFADVYESAELLTPIVVSRSTENRLRHYEGLPQRPAGLVVTGDAVCAFNPVYGQGMSAAALGALLLDECLHDCQNASSHEFAAQFQNRLAKTHRRLWLLATGEDYRYAEVRGPKISWTIRMSHCYLDRVTRLATQDGSLHRRMVEVLHLLRSPACLLTPSVLFRVLSPFGATSPNPLVARERR